jgi:hypothetical protein
MATVNARTNRNCIAHSCIQYVGSISETARFPIERLDEKILRQELGEVDELAVAPVEFPQDAIFADGDDIRFPFDIDEYAMSSVSPGMC